MPFSDISIIINNSKCICSDLQHADYSPAYAWFNYFLIIILLPSISVFGVLANILNIYVYSRKRMQTSANNYLLFLACSDFLVILTGLFIFWLDSARSYIPSLAHVPYMTVYALPFGYMAQTCSIYFTVAAAIDCYVQVSWEEIRDNYCTVKKAMEINICITLCSIIYNSLRFPQFNLRKCFHDATQELIIEICPTALFFAINTIYNVYMYMILMTLLPFLCLSILNAMIVVRKSVKPTDLEQNVENDDDTLTMIMVVVIFLCCNTLALIVNLIETFFNPDALLLNFLTDGSNFLVIFNSSVNCLIYLIFNKIYRQIFLYAFFFKNFLIKLDIFFLYQSIRHFLIKLDLLNCSDHQLWLGNHLKYDRNIDEWLTSSSGFFIFERQKNPSISALKL
ncbi:unnamed protein product [Dracunculus medinensis]|uniref:G_PROTEIN_RECEP_F1_2 domain-containing protein n=1 Tax=Dracunculus medinensis TaxID=318479 RepID=A0A0N4UCR6_DRAME|nr:unnamed protein product [Dracunculus medinensis]